MKFINFIIQKSDTAHFWEIGVFIVCTASAFAIVCTIIERGIKAFFEIRKNYF